MDLSFRPFLPDREIAAPRDLALLVAAARVDSPTARAQAILDAPTGDEDRPAPGCGSFDAAVAAALWRWRGQGRRE